MRSAASDATGIRALCFIFYKLATGREGFSDDHKVIQFKKGRYTYPAVREILGNVRATILTSFIGCPFPCIGAAALPLRSLLQASQETTNLKGNV